MVDVVASIDFLPDNIILEIFRHLSLKEVCGVGRVCKRWRRLTYDNALWKHVDLQQQRLPITKLWGIFHRHFSEKLLSLKIKGFVNADQRKDNWQKASLSDAMLRELQEKCPNLEELHVKQAALNKITCTPFPKSLKKLVLSGCLLPDDSLFSENKLPNLRHLNLSLCSKVNQDTVTQICTMKTLHVLKLEECYRLNVNSVKMVAESLINLEELNIGNIQLNQTASDQAVHHITRNLHKLARLDISYSKVSDNAVKSFVSLPKLRNLSLKKCAFLTEKSLLYLSDIRSLKKLEISLNTKPGMIGKETVKKFQSLVNDCDVVCH